MSALKKKWKMYCIHHSHTDIGYTDTQEEIGFHHIQFIKQVLDILRSQENNRQEWKGFKWNCESAWCVEQFLNHASEKDIQDFVHYVKEGKIGLSASYLNLTELVSTNVLNRTIEKVNEMFSKYSIQTHSAMTADINGYSWGFGDALYDHGIDNLLSCLHSHHGYHPTFEKQNPFYWTTPKGNKIFVWNGEHYLLGNELGIAQTDAFEYTIHDGLDQKKLDPYDKAEKRIFAYLHSLEKEEYPYTFIPVTVSGMMTDNSPPSTKVIEFIHRFNSDHRDQIEIQMVTLDEFFKIARGLVGDIPTYSGDWTDWWADGIGSTPDVVAHYRDASAKYDKIIALDPFCKIISQEIRDEICYNLIFYSEHTWGYSSSIEEPWHPNVNYLEFRKSLFAQKANELASSSLDKIDESNGKTGLSLYKDYRFKVVNPFNYPVTDRLTINMEVLFGHEHFNIIDMDTKESVPYQLGSYSRGYEFNILGDLKAKEEKTYMLEEIGSPQLSSAGRSEKGGLDGVMDLDKNCRALPGDTSFVNPYGLENRYFRITYQEEKGITSIFDKIAQTELIKQKDASAFMPIYEVTPVRENQMFERRDMGRNRKAIHTNRFFGKMSYVKVLEDGDLYSKVELGYHLEGASQTALILTAYKQTPRLDIDYRFHKASVWSPENLYLSLPFTDTSGESEVWIDKTSCILRPRIDQIPGTCTDFYLLQNGLVINTEKNTMALAFKDTPLLMMGDIKAHPIKLCGEPGVNNDDYLYAWIMNNFWETNFKASLGGFYQFGFSLITAQEQEPEQLFKKLKAINSGIQAFYMFDVD